MIPVFSALSFLILISPFFVSAACTDNLTDTAGLQKLLTDGSDGYKLQLCQNQIYSLTNTLNYTASNQVCQNCCFFMVKLLYSVNFRILLGNFYRGVSDWRCPCRTRRCWI